MESAIYLTLTINLENLVKNKLYICRDYHIQPSEIDRMPYYEYEMYLDNINEIQKQQEEDQKKREKEQRMPSYKMPQMPAMPKVSIPKFG